MADRTGEPWTDAEEQKLRALAKQQDRGETKLAEIAEELNRSVEACQFRARELGLDIGLPYTERDG